MTDANMDWQRQHNSTTPPQDKDDDDDDDDEREEEDSEFLRSTPTETSVYTPGHCLIRICGLNIQMLPLCRP